MGGARHERGFPATRLHPRMRRRHRPGAVSTPRGARRAESRARAGLPGGTARVEPASAEENIDGLSAKYRPGDRSGRSYWKL
ncbi:hypothetical protein EG877_16695, partial [Enterococcus faecalis]